MMKMQVPERKIARVHIKFDRKKEFHRLYRRVGEIHLGDSVSMN